MQFKVDGLWGVFKITADDPGGYSRFSYSRRKAQKIRVQVKDGYGHKQFPERKAGFDVAKIAETISVRVKASKERDRVDAKNRADDKAHAAIVEKVTTDEGLKKPGDPFYGSVNADSLQLKSSAKGIQVVLTVNGIKDEATLRDVLAKLQATGLTVKK